MKCLNSFSRLVATVLLVMAAVMGGCVQPDRLDLFKADPEKEIQLEDNRPLILPQALQPRPKDEPVVAEPIDGILELSVEQAVLLALRNNCDLRVQQFFPVIAGTFEQIERGDYDAELFSEMAYNKERAEETSRSTGTKFNAENTDTAVSVGIRQQLPAGTEIEASVEQQRSISNRAPEQQIARVGLSVTQALLRGAGPVVNLVAVRQAELETAASIHELRGFTESLLAETETAYWNYVLAKQEIAIFERSLAIARQQRDETEQRIEVGILPAIEAAAARAEVARREQALIDARSLLEKQRLRLLRLLGSGIDNVAGLMIKATSEPAIEPQPVADLADRLQIASHRRADLQEANLRLRQNRLETIFTRNGLLPKLELFISLGKTGFADTFSDTFKELDGSTYDLTAGVRLSHYLGNRTATARHRAALANRQQAAEAVRNLEGLIDLDVRLAVNEVERVRRQISASRSTRELQEQTMNAEKERFDVGASTALLVAQAQRDYLASLIAEVEAVVSYRIAMVQLYLAEGSLLERRGVSLDSSELL